jgi:hypothetical protein
MAMAIKLARVPNVHQDHTTDDCIVRVVAEARGGSARTLVRCMFTGEHHHVHPSSVRAL